MKEKPYNLRHTEESASAQLLWQGVQWKLKRPGWASTGGSAGGIIKKPVRSPWDEWGPNPKKQQTNPRASRMKEITKIRAELHNIETKGTILRINTFSCWFFEKINKIDRPLSRLIKKKRERTQINTIGNERGEIITSTTEIQRIVRNYYEELCAKQAHSIYSLFQHFIGGN